MSPATSTVVSTMQDRPLTITELLRHGASVYAGSVVHTFEGDAPFMERTFKQSFRRDCQ